MGGYRVELMQGRVSRNLSETIDIKTIPDIADKLAEVRKARDEWLGKSGRRALKNTKRLAGPAAAILTAIILPVMPVTMAIAGLGLVSGAAIPTVEYLLDLREGGKEARDNGRLYLLQL